MEVDAMFVTAMFVALGVLVCYLMTIRK